jgi:pyruvate kinase
LVIPTDDYVFYEYVQGVLKNFNMANTQIVCTIGPSSWDAEVMRKMIAAGMTFARVNGAFADTAELDKVTKLVRDVSNDVGLMMDVKGPEVRMNKFPAPIELEIGMEIEIGNTPDSAIYPANYSDLYQKLQIGQRVVIGDGDVELKIKSIQGDKMMCEVVYGDLLKPGKAMNLPGAVFATEVLTAKDLENLNHSLKLGWTHVSASFIQNAESARLVRSHLQGRMKLIAKIEDQQGLDNIDEILPEIDGVMIARGGLGVELGLEKVPYAQRYLSYKSQEAGKFFITATQMLESMTENPRPTRAEVNDVVTAVLLGSDALMLSAESSAGKYPVEAVEWMSKIATETENDLSSGRYSGLI